MIIHLTGTDTYRSAQRLAELRQAFIARHDPQGFNVVTLDASTATLGDVHAALSATGFFARKRFVAIDNYTGQGEVVGAALTTALKSAAPPSSDLIVIVRDVLGGASTGAGRTTRKTGKGVKRLAAVVELPTAKREEFPALDAAAAATWVEKQIRHNGGQIERTAVQRLVALTNGDSWRLAAEAEKLAMYAGGQTISVADVETMVSGEYRSDIFALTDALGQGQTARALSYLHRELGSGTNPFALIATLAGHVRNLWQVQRAQGRGLTPVAIASTFALHPFVVQKALSQTSRFSPGQLEQLHHRLVGIDHDLKSSPLDAETLLDLLIVAA